MAARAAHTPLLAAGPRSLAGANARLRRAAHEARRAAVEAPPKPAPVPVVDMIGQMYRSRDERLAIIERIKQRVDQIAERASTGMLKRLDDAVSLFARRLT